MSSAPISQFSLLVTHADGGSADPAVLEQFALELRAELTDAGVTRVEKVPAAPAPDGARSIEVLGLLTYIITVVQAGEAVLKVVRAIRHLAARYAQRGQRVRVTVDGTDTDLASANDQTVQRVVEYCLTRPAVSWTPQRTAPGHRGQRHALIITNATYDDPKLTQLRSPSHDGQALARALGNEAVGGFDVRLLADADERTVRRSLSTFFADRDRDDLLLVHFSCHGVKDPWGRLYLAARDTELSTLSATGIRAGFINELLAETHSRRVVLILDCCYSGAFARGVLPRSGVQVEVGDELGAGSGRVVLTASSATEYAFDGGSLAWSYGQPSAFTGALVEGLETGAADLNEDGEITIDELYEYVRRRIRETTPGQTPRRWILDEDGSLVLARSQRPAVLPESIREDLAQERPLLRLAAVDALTQLLQGSKPGLRATARATLVMLRDTDDSTRVRQAAAAALASVDSPVSPVPASPSWSDRSPDPPHPGTQRPTDPPPLTFPPDRPPLQPAVAGPAVAQPVIAQLAVRVRRWNSLAIIALICSFTYPPVGAILGHIARRKIRQTGKKGDKLALTAIIVGWTLTVILIVLGVVALANK